MTQKQDFYAGLLFIVFGVLFAVVSKNYPMGTAVRMGPAYFPTILGWVLAILGAITTLKAFIPKVKSEAVPPLIMKPLFFVILAVVVFGLLVDFVGVVPATFALVFISCLAGWTFNFKETLILGVVMSVLTVAIFVYGLGLPFKLFPSFS